MLHTTPLVNRYRTQQRAKTARRCPLTLGPRRNAQFHGYELQVVLQNAAAKRKTARRYLRAAGRSVSRGRSRDHSAMSMNLMGCAVTGKPGRWAEPLGATFRNPNAKRPSPIHPGSKAVPSAERSGNSAMFSISLDCAGFATGARLPTPRRAASFRANDCVDRGAPFEIAPAANASRSRACFRRLYQVEREIPLAVSQFEFRLSTQRRHSQRGTFLLLHARPDRVRPSTSCRI